MGSPSAAGVTLCVECRNDKHQSCDGWAFNDRDGVEDCGCECTTRSQA